MSEASTLRECVSCHTLLPLTKFKRRGSGDARHTMCNRCLYVKYTRPEAERKTQEVSDYKMAKGCADCGYSTHPAALEFDHLPGSVKSFNIMEKVGSYSREKIWAEISKCEVVCANCHAVRTATRRVLVSIEVA